MPYRSNAQRKYFHAALAKGDIKPSTVEEFDKASKGLKLPEKVGSKRTKKGAFSKALA